MFVLEGGGRWRPDPGVVRCAAELWRFRSRIDEALPVPWKAALAERRSTFFGRWEIEVGPLMLLGAVGAIATDEGSHRNGKKNLVNIYS